MVLHEILLLFMIKKLLIFILFLFIIPLVFVHSAYAQTRDERRSVVLPRTETVNGNYFNAGDRVTLSGTVNGDVYVAGGTVMVEGAINGDLIAAGGTVTVRGNVSQDVRVLGGQVVISGTVGESVSAAGGTVIVTDSARIGDSLVVASGNLEMYAPVAGEADIAAGDVVIGGTIGDDMKAAVGELTLTSDAQIAGDLTYWSDAEVQVQQGAQVAGQITREQPLRQPRVDAPAIGAGLAGLAILFKIGNFILYLIVGLLIIKLLPNYTNRTLGVISRKPWISLLAGFFTLLIFPVVFFGLLITIIGIPIAFLLLPILIVLIYLGVIFVSLFIGQKILGYFSNKARVGWALVVGLIVYELATLLPIVGGLITLVVIMFGLGAVLIEEKNLYEKLRSRNLI
jgi:cytoskeletal protein CcmA (bactofilin family)